ncbi:MAG: hypothetical protein IJB79_06875 [Candidatus Gastranaerophilales bacterium]|nr:hypothetical protein [Candidatus Gastranaerophilales bacterium]
MDINNNTNISSQIANSISKLNLNTARRAFEVQKSEENTPNTELQEIKKDDIQLIDEKKIQQTAKKSNNNGIDVAEIQQYASSMGESLTIDDINYGLMYGRSVIADFCV